jgi:plastocyanin
MDTTMAAPRTQALRRPTGLRAVVVGALVGFALMFVYLQAVLAKQVIMPLPIFSAISLVLASLVAGWPVGGWRWAPLLGTLWSLVLLAGNFNRIRYELAHPESTHLFAWQLVVLALVATGVAAGIGATVQNYRRAQAEQGLPRWAKRGFAVMAGLLVGAVAVAAIPRAGGGVQVSPATMAQLPVVPIEAFNDGEIRVRAGQLTALRLDNPSAGGHSFDVDELGIHTPMPSNSESVVVFTAPAPGVYTFYCEPHYDKATGEGMRGTLIVEP